MDERQRTLRCSIDGQWTAADMAASFQAFEDLYNLRASLQVLAEDARDWERVFFELMEMGPFRHRLRRKFRDPRAFFMFSQPGPDLRIGTTELRQFVRLALPHRQLTVVRIEYASPGLKDLLGAGEIIGHVKDFALRIIEHWWTKDQRSLDNQERHLRNERLRQEIEEKQLQNEAIRIENARSFVELARELGYDDSEVRRIAGWVDERQSTLIDSAANGRMTSVTVLEDEEGSSSE